MTAPTTARRVTPTAYRVLPADAGRDEWLAERRKGVGSSDVSAVLGLVEQKTPVHVWRDKRGEDIDTAGEAALWGRLLEEPVAREWARRNRSVIARVGLVANLDEPWMLATLDRRVAECPLNRQTREACALEVKTRNAFTAARWRADVPDDVLAQVTWQMRVTGYDHIHVAVLIGGQDYRQTVVRRDQALEAFVVGEVGRFWTGHVLPDVEPVWDMDKAAALIALDELRHPDRDGTHELTLPQLDDVAEYAEASAAKATADKRLKAARARLAQLAHGHQVMTCADELVYQFTPVTRGNADLGRLAEQFPDAYAACVTTKTSHQIRIAPAYRHRSSNDDE